MTGLSKLSITTAIAPSAADLADETAPLLRHDVCQVDQNVDPEGTGAVEDGEPKQSQKSILGVLSVFLIGVFVSQADTSLVLATYGEIASEFGRLESSSWLLSSYMLAMCVGQPLYGKLSDIFGRKAMLQIAYGLFAIGSGLCGVSKSMIEMIVARAIQGVGGAGMVCLVSILITDLVPLRDVATYRSYVNVVQTVGRSCGGVIGGWLAQVLSWRWAFLVQVPLTALAMVLVAWKLRLAKQGSESPDPGECESMRERMSRIDFVGILFLSASVLALLMVLEMGGTTVPWVSIQSGVLVGVGVISGVLFIAAERHWAREPVFPLELLSHYDVVTSYTILALQNASQTSLMFFIPLYFQVTRNSSPAEAGAYLIPAIIGNTVGGLATGFYIRRTGCYKSPTIVSSISAGVCFILLIIFWHGNTHPWQSTSVFFGGLATGVAHSSIFVAVSAGVGETKMAIAGSGLYLSGNVGAVTGVAASSAVFQTSLRAYLTHTLSNMPNGKDMVEKVLSDISFVHKLSGRTHSRVISDYVSSFQHTFIMCLVLAGICLLVSCAMRQIKLT